MSRAQRTERGATSPWVVAIVVGLTLVAIVNFAFIYVAVRGADPIVPSYVSEPR